MNISSLRARIRSLRRKLALPYAQLMVQRAAGDLCTGACAQADKRPTPSPQAFVRRVAHAGFLLPFSVAGYLERCASLCQEPSPERLLRIPPPLGRLSPRGVLMACRRSYPPLTRLSRESGNPRARPGSRNPEMPHMKTPCVYILASKPKGTLYHRRYVGLGAEGLATQE